MHGFERNEAGKLFVGGLSWDTSKDSLLEYFSQYGEVIDCVVMKNPETGKSRGFGFVTYRDTSCVDTVLSVPAHIVDGRQVDPKACNPKGTNRGGGGGAGGGQMGGEHRMNRGPRGGGGGPQGDRKIFLGGLPNGVDEEAIRNFFGQYGKVLDVTVMYDAQKQRSRGFGFLTFESDDAVNQVCREHFVNFNGKKVECKRATPRNQGNQGNEEPPPHPLHMPHPGGMPHLEMGMQPQQHGPGPMPGPEPQWTSPEGWNPHVQQSPPPPPQVGVPPQFQPGAVQFQPGYQGEVPAGAPPGWPQQPPPQGAGGWPPGAPPPQQPGVAPGSAQFLPQQQTASQSFASAPGTPGAPVYQYATAPSGQQPPQPNGQGLPQVAAVGQPAPSSYGYTTTTYAAPNVALPQNARQYQDFAVGSPQVQIATTMAPLQGTPAPTSTAVSYSAYPSPYGAPVPAGAAPTVAASDPYAQTALAHPQGAVQVAAPAVAPPTGQPGGVPGYGSPLAQSPVAAGSGDPAAPKTVDYSSYYSAYGYAVEASPTAVTAAYGAQPTPAQAPAPAQAPYAPQEVPQAVAYGGAPAPSPTFQRQSSGQQFHPYARR
ncbi:DAZ-associated protein 1-like isoform X3 [Ruditapes philippinarum]|uniref:DAZ-associated protein 1-like isoform X3 n=1 Tax=Ruditapes philippinarum TaxID=129788 RepID=UPI00295ABA6C|nr:DAZ-associated protein 1-like isoform X3 [Ruditapes philippinarum]